MEQSLKEDLEALTCNGNTAILPRSPLNNYLNLKKILVKATGKYYRNTFRFELPAQAVIDCLLKGEMLDFKKEFQFFETPPAMAEHMSNQILGMHEQGVEMLEPQAGRGALIRAVLKDRPNLNVTAIELSALNFKCLLRSFHDVNLIHADFLTHDFKGKKFDLIVANPPFAKNQDITHVYKMYELLKPGGQLITIMGTSWTFGTVKKQMKFKDWVENEVYGTFTANGQGTFKTSGTLVNTMLVEITK